MAEDLLFDSDYDGPCPLCEEQDLELSVSRKDIERVELKREHNKGVWFNDNGTVSQERKVEGTEHLKKEEKQGLKVIVKSDYEYGHGEGEVVKTDDKNKTENANVSPLLDSNLHLDSSYPVNLVMVCEESVERCLSEEFMLCPPRSLKLPQIPSLSPAPSNIPLSLTVPTSNPPLHKTQTMVQSQAPAQASEPEGPCLDNGVCSNSPSAVPKTLATTGQLEVTLRQVYTRRYTRFTSRPGSLLSLQQSSVHPDTSSQPLPYITSTSLLPPAPKKKTRTSYSTDQLEELERVFQDDHYPDAEKRKEIAISVGVTPQRVMVWFQNRRAKWRKTSKTAVKKAPVSRAPAPAPTRAPAPVHRPPAFGAPTVATIPSQTANTLPPYSALLTSCTNPSDLGFADAGNVCLSQGSSVDYKLPLMQSPPPLRRASLPFFAAYNPPTHTLSVLLDTPEHSEHQSLNLHADTGFDYDGMGPSAKFESVTSGPGHLRTTQPFQISTYPQQPSTLFPQQSNTLLAHQGNNVMSQQPNPRLPQYSHLSYLTPSPYLTPNPSEGTTSSCMPLNTGTTSSLLACTNGGHAYFQCQNGSQILLQPGVQALQAYPWTSEVYGHSAHIPHAVLRPQFASQSCESLYPQLLQPQRYITPQRATCSSLSKPAAPDPIMPSIKTELEDAGQSQLCRVSETEKVFHCDFSPIHF